MIVDNYTITMTCDKEGCISGPWKSPGTNQFYGQTRAECVKQAKQEGWAFLFTPKVAHYCPQCGGKR